MPLPLIIFCLYITLYETVEVLLSKAVLFHGKLLTPTRVLNYFKTGLEIKAKYQPP